MNYEIRTVNSLRIYLDASIKHLNVITVRNNLNSIVLFELLLFPQNPFVKSKLLDLYNEITKNIMTYSVEICS